MKKKTNITKSRRVEPQELLQLNQAHADAALAQEKFYHQGTRSQLQQALAEVCRLQAEVNSLKIADSARVDAEKHQRMLQEVLDHKKARQKHVEDLARDLRDRYSVGDEFAIDPLSGDFLDLEK